MQINYIEVCLKSGEQVLTRVDKDGRKTVFDITGSVGLIISQLDLLRSYRDDGRVPSQELLDDIKAYECIVGSSDVKGRAEKYFEIRNAERSLRPRHVARKLGWM